VTIKSIIFNSLKVILLVLLAGVMKSYGIFNAWGIALVTAVLAGLFFFIPRLRKGYLPRPSFRWNELTDLLRYSILNNIAFFLWNVTGRILPLLIISIIGAEANGYFYIAWTIAATIAFIPASLSNSLFAEGSNEEKGLETKIINSLSLVIVIMIPIFLVVIIFGGLILKIFGAAYAANATSLLQCLIIAQFPLSVNQIYFGVLRIQKNLKPLIILGITIAVLTTAISYWLLPILGIVGVGIGWLASQAVTALWILSKQHWWKPLFRQMTTLLIQRNNHTRNQK
jgi:O-antigen/teichoic acid export membrane protein